MACHDGIGDAVMHVERAPNAVPPRTGEDVKYVRGSIGLSHAGIRSSLD